MKVLAFAHIPPPHHGQSYMVQLMLENVGRPKSAEGEELVFCHVNAQLSEDLEDIGAWRLGKLILLLGYILKAWWVKLTQNPEILYYVPAPAKRSAIYRDWLVLLLVAPLFRKRVLHWHSIGLGQWIAESAGHGFVRRCEAALTRLLFVGKELSLVLSENGRRDIEILQPGRVIIMPNGIPDPCPEFKTDVLPGRVARVQEENRPPIFEILFLAHATRTKGLFDSVEAVALANAQLAKDPNGPRFRLTVAGTFVEEEEEQLFEERIRQDDLVLSERDGRAVVYMGYVGAKEKDRLLRATDALCFASYFPNEAQPVSVIEALAYGLPVVLSKWRGLPDMVPAPLGHLTEPNDPASLARALPGLFKESRFEEYRACYLQRYSLTAFRDHMRDAFFSASK